MSLWTSCLGRDCLLLDLGQRRNYGHPLNIGQRGRCRNSASGDCADRRTLSLFGHGRAADGAVPNAREPIE